MRISALVTLILCISCSSTPNHSTSDFPSMNRVPKQGSFPIPSAEKETVFSKRKPLSEHYRTRRVIRLEVTDESIMGMVGKVVKANQNIAVMDSVVPQVVLFSPEGDFICKVGREGQGPGEYTSVRNVHFSNSQSKRPQRISKARTPRMIPVGFERVADYLWVWHRFETDIQVYDLNGNHMATLSTGVDGATREDYEAITSDDAFREFASKTGPYKLLVTDDYVFAMFGTPRQATVFDHNGNLLEARVRGRTLLSNTIISTVGPDLVAFIAPTVGGERLQAELDAQTYRMLIEAGYDPNDYENDNPYLAFLQVK